MSLTKEDVEVIKNLIADNNEVLEKKLEAKFDEKLDTALAPIRTDIQFIKHDIETLKKDVKDLKFSVTGLRHEIDADRCDIRSLQYWRAGLELRAS